MGVRLSAAAILASIACLGSPAAAAQEPQFGKVGLTLFSDPDFSGRSASLRVDTPNLETIGMNDVVSSLRVAPGERWEVCEHANYQGRCRVVSGSEPNLQPDGWNKTISSARRVGGGGQQSPGQPLPAGSGLHLFSREGFRGQSRAFTGAEDDLRRADFNDVARSLRIGQGETWEVCVNANFVDCRVVNSDWSDLNGLGFAGRISSVRPRTPGGVTATPAPVPATGRGIELFSLEGFKGDRRHFTDAVEDLRRVGFNDAAQSLRIGPGESWEICVNANFVDCRVENGDRPDLGGFARRVSSLRPAGRPGSAGTGGDQPYLMLYEDRGYRGRSFRVDGDARTLPSSVNLTGSVQVFGGTWELCEQTEFAGRCAVVTGSVPDLRALGLRSPVASARPVQSRR